MICIKPNGERNDDDHDDAEKSKKARDIYAKSKFAKRFTGAKWETANYFACHAINRFNWYKVSQQ